jgi:hypothetical protein
MDFLHWLDRRSRWVHETIGKSGILAAAAWVPLPGRIGCNMSISWHSIMRRKEQKGIARERRKSGANVRFEMKKIIYLIGLSRIFNSGYKT